MELRFQQVSAAYGRVKALEDVSFTVAQGSFTCIVGPNGAGKSTIAQIAAGSVSQVSGQVIIDGQDQHMAAPDARARNGVSLVPEGRHIFTSLTVEENLIISGGNASARGWSKSDQTQELERTYARFPILRERRSAFAGTLSGGEQQMLAISRALLTRPELLIIDEPSLGLAPKITALVYETIAQINKDYGLTLLVIEQNVNRVLAYADHIVVMRNGQVRADKPRAEINGVAELEEAFFGYSTKTVEEV